MFTLNLIRNSLIALAAGSVLISCAGTDIRHSPSLWKPFDVERFAGTADYDMFRKDHPTGYLRADGDFNGDGKPDYAEYLENQRTGDIRLVAFVSTKTGELVQHVLDELDFNDVARMGISTHKPGQRRTVCKRYDMAECNVDTITLRYDSLSNYVFESSSSYFYFHSGKFYRLWESD